MIFPLEVKIDRVDKPEEDFTSHGDLYEGLLGKRHVPLKAPSYRVIATLLDTERSRVVEYEFHTMIDATKPASEGIGTISHTDVKHHRKYLTRLRDELNRALGES